MKKLQIAAACLLAVLLATSCANDDVPQQHTSSKTLKVEFQRNAWTYISLENGAVIGTSKLGDAAADSLWHNLTTWDIAICNGAIRTNSGASGIGQGGIAATLQPFDEVDPAKFSQLNIDADTVTIPLMQ